MLWALNSRFLLLDAHARLMTLLKKRLDFHQNQIRGSDAHEGESLQVLYIMNLVSLVAFENCNSFATITVLQNCTKVTY